MDKTQQSAEALRLLAEKLGRWPTTSEWNEVAQKHNYIKYPYISRKLQKKNWTALKAAFGYDKDRKIALSEQALFRHAHQIGYWPTTKEWNEYARRHGYYTYTQLHVKTQKGWAEYQKEAGLLSFLL